MSHVSTAPDKIFFSLVVSLVVRFTRHLIASLEVYKQRRQLAQLSADSLKDIGISPAQANREASRSFWDIPYKI